jgi:hypothetical protein
MTTPNPSVGSDFTNMAQAPSGALSGGLAEAFRSNETPPFEQMIAGLFNNSNPEQRAGILNHLIAAAGPAAAGILERFRAGGAGSGAGVTPEQAQQIDPGTVSTLAKQAHEKDSSVVERASEFYAQHPKLIQGLGAAALAMIMSHVSRRH